MSASHRTSNTLGVMLPRSLYIQFLINEAVAAGLDPQYVHSQTRNSDAAVVRWRVWRRLREKGASFMAIEHMTGNDHSTIVRGLARLKKIEQAGA